MTVAPTPADKGNWRKRLFEKVDWIWLRWQGHKGWLILLFGFTLVSTAVKMAYPLVFMKFFDVIAKYLVPGADKSEAYSKVHNILLLVAAIGLARFVSAFYPGFRALLNSKIDLDVRLQYFNYVLKKGYRFFTRFRTGDLVTRLTDDIYDYPKVSWYCRSGIFRAVESGSGVVFCLGVMFWLDAELALLSLIPMPLMIGAFMLLHKKLGRASEIQRETASQTTNHLEAAFSGVQVVQAGNAESRLADRLDAQLVDRKAAEVRLQKMWVIFGLMWQSMNHVGQLVVVVWGGLRYMEGSMSLGTFVAFYQYTGMLLAPLMDLPNLLVTGRQAFVCIDRLEEIRTYDTEGEGGAFRGEQVADNIDDMALQEVRFAYPLGAAPKKDGNGKDAGANKPSETKPVTTATATLTGPPVLEGVDLDLHRGERLAIVGRIGSGKTTLLRLLSGIAVPTQGRVTLNGTPLAEYAGSWFRTQVGFVPQDPVLFSSTIKENIVFGRAEDEAKLALSLDLAGLADEVGDMEDGVDRELGQRGLGLSGGQRQRLTIARALYDMPQVLILDDITAALDAENEERFWQELFARWPDLTALVVTHRVATASRMDRIAVLEDGRVTAVGTHEQLLASSRFYRRFNLQEQVTTRKLPSS